MTNLELLDILGSVQGKYILEAQQMRTGGKKIRRFPYGRQLAAVIALVLMLTIFLNTSPGAAAVEFVKEKVVSLIEALFPPKKMTINIESFEVEGDYAADGVEPEGAAEASQPGFAIYYDVDHYTMVKEGNVTYIRPNLDHQPDDSLPACEVEITHLDMACEQAASRERAELEGKWEIQEFTKENRITFSMLGGHEWNSPVEDRDYISDEQGGCFRIIRRYFLEAAEGHGARFGAIVDTFSVLPPQGSGEEKPFWGTAG